MRLERQDLLLLCYSSVICLLRVKREGKKRKVPEAHARACALSPAPLHGRVGNPGAPPGGGGLKNEVG